MAKRGRKKRLILDLEGCNTLVREVDGLLRTRLGKKKPYMVALTFASEDEENIHSYVLGNVDERLSFKLFRLVTGFFANTAKGLITKFDISDVDLPKDGVIQVGKRG